MTTSCPTINAPRRRRAIGATTTALVDDHQDYGQDYQDEPRDDRADEPVRYETINRVRPAYQQSNRPLPAANRRVVANDGYDERADRAPRDTVRPLPYADHGAARPGRPSPIVNRRPPQIDPHAPALTAAHDCPIVTLRRGIR